MAWSPGPALSRSLDFPNYDERDPWTKRFLSEAENGELALNENVRGILHLQWWNMCDHMRGYMLTSAKEHRALNFARSSCVLLYYVCGPFVETRVWLFSGTMLNDSIVVLVGGECRGVSNGLKML